MKKQIKVRIPSETLLVDVEAWATEFGIDPKDVKKDVLSYFSNWCAMQLEQLGLGKEAGK